jgi:molybdate transport system regulatory protein
LSCEVELALGPSTSIFAEVTRRSVETLGLHVGREAMALIKAPFVSVVAAPAETRNRLAGVVRRVEASGEEAEATLDIGQGKTIAALMRADAAHGLAEGADAFACFDAAQVILAID